MADNKKGFTLLEVMVSMAILAIAFVALLGLRDRSIKTINDADNLSKASFIADRVMGKIQLFGLERARKEKKVEDEYKWTATLAPTPIQSMQELRLTIWRNGENIIELVEYIY